MRFQDNNALRFKRELKLFTKKEPTERRLAVEKDTYKTYTCTK